jgi:sensor histidine kinase YesM
MKTRGIKDLYLPKSISIHVKYLLICAAFTPLWGVFINEHSNIFLIGTFSMMLADLEIIRLFTNKMFKISEIHTQKFEDTHTRKEVTLTYVSVFVLFLVVVLAICTLVFVLFLIVYHLIEGWGFPNLFRISNEMKGVIKVTSIALLCSTPLFLYGKWQDAMKRGYELREQNLVFQNETLKNQVNPHFLFNCLNTLSALVTAQPEVAEEFIHRMSSIYRYILENSSKDRVPLSVELSFIKDYFYLHKIRDDDKIQLEIKVDETDNSEILPVSLQILIENAIKHNKATRESPLRILICIENNHVIVKNNLQKMALQLKSTEIGLRNLAQRVNLITGKALIIEETTAEFIVKIPLL